MNVDVSRVNRKQECIPVGCVPPAAVVIAGWISPLDVSLDVIPLNSPLGVGLDLIPLNFPLGCGPGPDPLNFPLVSGLGGGSPWWGSPWQVGVSLAGRGLPGRGAGVGGLPACTEADSPRGQTDTCKT